MPDARWSLLVKLCEIASLNFLQASLMEALSQMWSYLLINLSKEHPPGNRKYTMWTWRENVASQNHLSCQKYVREKTGEGRGLNKKEMNFANVSKTKATLGCGNQHRVCDYTFWWIQKWNILFVDSKVKFAIVPFSPMPTWLPLPHTFLLIVQKFIRSQILYLTFLKNVIDFGRSKSK